MNIELQKPNPKQLKQVLRLMRQFLDSYTDGYAPYQTPETYRKGLAQSIKDGTVYIIRVDQQEAGLLTMQEMMARDTGKLIARTISDIYVHPEFRSKGVATKARQIALNKCGAKGTFVTYGRARKLFDYYQQQGLTHVSAIGGEPGNDHNLCVLTTSKLDKTAHDYTLANVDVASKAADAQFPDSMKFMFEPDALRIQNDMAKRLGINANELPELLNQFAGMMPGVLQHDHP